jgi:hypothetical protein
MKRYGQLLKDHPDKVLALLLFVAPPTSPDMISVAVFEAAGDFDRHAAKNRMLMKSLEMARSIIDER